MLTIDLARAGIGSSVRVLDLGCGGGRHTFACARAGAGVVAVDLSRAELEPVVATLTAMEEANEIPDPKSTAACCGDARALPFGDASFDVVVCSEVLEHLGDDRAAIAECARVLRDGGTLAVSVPRAGPERMNWWLSDEYHRTEGGHVRVYRRAQLVARCRRSGLELVDAHHAHALHSPYWWLRCALGVTNDDHPLVRAYHRLLVFEIVRRPRALQILERLLAPVMGKSLVLYFRRASR